MLEQQISKVEGHNNPLKDNSTSVSPVPVSLIPYTSGTGFGSASESYKEKLLIPQRKRKSNIRIQTVARKGASVTMRKSTIPKTPPACFSRKNKKKEFTEAEVKDFENYFRESKYFLSTGKIPAEWLIHFSDQKLKQIMTARKKVLKERETVGHEAWKTWKEEERQRKPFPPAPVIKDGCWGKEHIKREPSHMTEEEREKIWRRWKERKEEQIRREKEEEKEAREKLIEEAMKLANHRRLMAAQKKAQAQGLSMIGIGESDLSVAAMSEVTTGDARATTVHDGSFTKATFNSKPPRKPGTMKKRKPNDVKVAMCLASLSPYLVHPSAKYKKENLHALDEMKSVHEMYRDVGPNGKLHLPKLWRKRIKEAEPMLFHHAKENQIGDLSVSTLPSSRASLDIPHSVNSSSKNALPLADTSIILPLSKEVKKSVSNGSSSSLNIRATKPLSRQNSTKSSLKEKYSAVSSDSSLQKKEIQEIGSPKSEKYDDDNFDSEDIPIKESTKENTVTIEEKVEEENPQEQKLEEDFILHSNTTEDKSKEKVRIEVNTTDTYELSNKDKLPLDKPFEDDANYYDDYSFCSDDGQNVQSDNLDKKVSGDLEKAALKELQGAQADRPESRSNSRDKN